MKQIKDIKFPPVNPNPEKITIVNPIEFLSEEENLKLIEELKESVKSFNDPSKWMTWEESCRLLDEKYGKINV